MRKVSLWESILLIFVISILEMGLLYKQAEQQPAKKISQGYIPTVFLHGSPTTRNSMLPLIERLRRDSNGNHNLTLIVDDNGVVHADGSYQKVNHPLIQIIFNNNDSTEYNQVKWLASCLEYLKKNYHIKQINFVGHSLGGVDVLLYLAQYEPKVRRKVPKIVKVVSLGSPFNGVSEGKNLNYKKIEKKGPSKTTETYDYVLDGIKKHPLNVNQWLNIAGDKYNNEKGDSTVPLGSVAALSPIMAKEHIKYKFKVVPFVSHSGLHESMRVDQLIEEFLWGKY